MTPWRYGRGWKENELTRLLVRAGTLAPNFRHLPDQDGWNVVQSHALVASERAGPPEGAFARLWHAVERFQHSDPRIVVAHFREGVPLVGRNQLLELRALGLRFLCPVRIAAARDEADEERTIRGFALETLEGHIERGREWFLLEKDHATGQVHFRIEAVWRPGDFPSQWSRLGFHLVGRRYQRAWHRLAHLRLRRIAAGLDPDENVGPGGMVHEGSPMPSEPVQFFAQRGVGRLGIDLEKEVENMGPHRYWRAAALGALSGVRSAGGAAVIARRRHGLLRRRTPLGGVLSAIAAAELVADKLPFMPARTEAPGVIARAASGAWVASRAAGRRGPKLAPALLGAAAAVAATFASYRLRQLAIQRSRALGYAVALAEDALVLLGTSRLSAA